MSDRSRQELLEELMDLGLEAMLERFREGKVTSAELSVIHKMFRDAGLTLAFDGKPSSAAVDAVLEEMKKDDLLN